MGTTSIIVGMRKSVEYLKDMEWGTVGLGVLALIFGLFIRS
jgi:hypothetical protein